MAEKLADFQLADIVEPELVVQVQAVALGADGDSRDDGDLVATIAVAMDGRLAAGRPGLDYVGDQEESGFVGKDEVGAQPCGVFFSRGQSFCFQRSMASSSRSAARRSGFW